MNLLTLYLDVTNAQFIQGFSRGTPFLLPVFYQHDVIPLELYLLQANPDGGIITPYSYIDDSNLSAKLGLVTADPSSPTVHASTTLTHLAGSNPAKWTGTLTLGSAIDTLLGTATEAECEIELELNDAGSSAVATKIQRSVTVKADGLTAASPPEDPPGDHYPSAAEIGAAFVRKNGLPGESFRLVSPNGNHAYVFHCDDNGVLHQDYENLT